MGNNARRFGLWDTHIDWNDIFRSPNSYIDGLYTDEEIEDEFVYEYPEELWNRLSQGGLDPEFDISAAYLEVTRAGGRPREAISRSMAHHVEVIRFLASDFTEAQTLVREIEGDIHYRIRQFAKCIAKTTDNYKNWLQEEYTRLLEGELRRLYAADE